MAMVNVDNKKQIIIIIFAVAAGIIASALVGGYVSSKVNEETTRLSVQYDKAQKQKEQQYNEQFAALGQKMTEVEQNARRAVEEAAKAAAKKPAEDVSAKKRSVSLALRTPAGKRAITVMLESLEAVGGLLNPGDFVDVIAHLNVPVGKKKEDGSETKEPVTAMIFQNLQVLAINTNLDEPGIYDVQQKERLLKITFAVDPQEAGLLAFAEKNGKLELALRSPSEKGHPMLSSATWTSLSEYVLENNGADIQSSVSKMVEAETKDSLKVETENVEQPRPYIQIYRGGKEL